jgi:hypothetical protein
MDPFPPAPYSPASASSLSYAEGPNRRMGVAEIAWPRIPERDFHSNFRAPKLVKFDLDGICLVHLGGARR